MHLRPQPSSALHVHIVDGATALVGDRGHPEDVGPILKGNAIARGVHTELQFWSSKSQPILAWV